MSYYIYKICCDDCPDFVYVGSTKVFRQRKNQHKKCYNNGDTQKLYTTIRENGGWDNWRMVILEDLGEVSLTQSRIKEEEHRVKLNGNLNMRKCHQTEEEKKERHNKGSLKSYHNNKEKNKDKKQECEKKYRENNKEIIEEKRSQRVTCECGRNFRIDTKARHEKTKIHKKLIEEKNNINII
jgi:hypothetical protein